MSTINQGVFSSVKQDWETPPKFVELVEKKFNIKFDIDACCYAHTAKAPRYFTEATNGLIQDWCNLDGSPANVWMNPPYGRALPTWMEKAKQESIKHGSTVFCLIPGRTDTGWFHDSAPYGQLVSMKGRLNFLQNGQEQGSPAFPSVLIIFGKGYNGIVYWDWKPEMKLL